MTAPAPAAPAPAAPAGDAPAATPPAVGSPPVVPPGARVAGQPGAAEPAATEPDQVEKLPQWAQKLVSELRDKDAKGRLKLTEAETRQKAILKAAGIDTDETDPTKLAEIAQNERQQAQAERTEAQRELAIYRSAPAGTDVSGLLDSRSFLASIANIDPTDTAAITAAITAATENGKFKTTPRAGGASGADFTGGTGGPTDLQSRISAAEKAGDWSTAIALKQQLQS